MGYVKPRITDLLQLTKSKRIQNALKLLKTEEEIELFRRLFRCMVENTNHHSNQYKIIVLAIKHFSLLKEFLSQYMQEESYIQRLLKEPNKENDFDIYPHAIRRKHIDKSFQYFDDFKGSKEYVNHILKSTTKAENTSEWNCASCRESITIFDVENKESFFCSNCEIDDILYAKSLDKFVENIQKQITNKIWQ